MIQENEYGEPTLWVIKRKALSDFYELPSMERSEVPLLAWYAVVRKANWETWADVKATYNSAGLVGDCVVFDIGANKFRLITRIRFQSHKVFILKVMTNKEYDRKKWTEDCGCFAEPPVNRIKASPAAQSVKVKPKRKR